MKGFRVLEAPASVASMPAAAPTAPAAVPAPAPAQQPAAETSAPASAAPIPAAEPREFRDAGEELVWLTQRIKELGDRKKALIEECLKTGNVSFPSGEVKQVVSKGSIDQAKLNSFLVEEYHLDIPSDVVEKFRGKSTVRNSFIEKKAKKKPAE